MIWMVLVLTLGSKPRNYTGFSKKKNIKEDENKGGVGDMWTDR